MVASLNEPVVCGFDGTLVGIGALDLAADEAMARVVPLVVLYIVPAGLDPALPQHRRLLDLAVSRAAAEHPGLSVSGDVVGGPAVDTLVARSEGACLLVVGHAHVGNGSVAARVVARAVPPVIVHRPLAVRRGLVERAVLTGVEKPGHRTTVLDFAATEATLRGARVEAVGARHPFADLVAGSRDAALVVVDRPLGRPLIDVAACPVAVVGARDDGR